MKKEVVIYLCIVIPVVLYMFGFRMCKSTPEIILEQKEFSVDNLNIAIDSAQLDTLFNVIMRDSCNYYPSKAHLYSEIVLSDVFGKFIERPEDEVFVYYCDDNELFVPVFYFYAADSPLYCCYSFVTKSKTWHKLTQKMSFENNYDNCFADRFNGSYSVEYRGEAVARFSIKDNVVRRVDVKEVHLTTPKI